MPALAGRTTWDPSAPWVIPAGYLQYVVSDESDLNGYRTVANGGDAIGTATTGTT